MLQPKQLSATFTAILTCALHKNYRSEAGVQIRTWQRCAWLSRTCLMLCPPICRRPDLVSGLALVSPALAASPDSFKRTLNVGQQLQQVLLPDPRYQYHNYDFLSKIDKRHHLGQAAFFEDHAHESLCRTLSWYAYTVEFSERLSVEVIGPSHLKHVPPLHLNVQLVGQRGEYFGVGQGP